MHECIFSQLSQGGDHGHAPDQFRNQAKFDQVLGLDILERLGQAARFFAFDGGSKTNAGSLRTVFDDFFQARERTAADKENVGGIDLQEILVRMLATALRRHRCHGALNQLEQGLLHSLARDITGNRWVIRLA